MLAGGAAVTMKHTGAGEAQGDRLSSDTLVLSRATIRPPELSSDPDSMEPR